MLQFLRSLSRQSNPSILTEGLFPKFALMLMHPPFLEEEVDGDADPGDLENGNDESGEIGGISCFSSLNRAS